MDLFLQPIKLWQEANVILLEFTIDFWHWLNFWIMSDNLLFLKISFANCNQHSEVCSSVFLWIPHWIIWIDIPEGDKLYVTPHRITFWWGCCLNSHGNDTCLFSFLGWGMILIFVSCHGYRGYLCVYSFLRIRTEGGRDWWLIHQNTFSWMQIEIWSHQEVSFFKEDWLIAFVALAFFLVAPYISVGVLCMIVQ